jgi:hypothetical protein
MGSRQSRRAVVHDPGPFIGPLINLPPHVTWQPVPVKFHLMKETTTTQSLRALQNAGPVYWRHDGGSFNVCANFKMFQLGFTDLLGRNEFIANADMSAFANFILQVTCPHDTPCWDHN